MNSMRTLPPVLAQKESFSRSEFSKEMKNCYTLTDTQVAYDLDKRLKKGLLIRSGWGQYSLPKEKALYNHPYSAAAAQVATTITEQFSGLNFQVFELVQLNSFMNHLVAHNTIFVWVENDLLDYVFGALWKAYPGRVLRKPRIDEYYRYLQEDEIVVNRLPSESPKGYGNSWKSRLEKILVDVAVDKLISGIVPDGEKRAIFDNAFHDYLIDVNTMLSYAKRKGAEKKIQEVLREYGRMT